MCINAQLIAPQKSLISFENGEKVQCLWEREKKLKFVWDSFNYGRQIFFKKS